MLALNWAALPKAGPGTGLVSFPGVRHLAETAIDPPLSVVNNRKYTPTYRREAQTLAYILEVTYIAGGWEEGRWRRLNLSRM
jgi:hypothetical protein